MELSKQAELEDRVAEYIRGKIGGRQYHDGEIPTIRQIARSLRVTQKEVLEAAEGSYRFMINVGFRTGAGLHEYENIGDYSIELNDQE